MCRCCKGLACLLVSYTHFDLIGIDHTLKKVNIRKDATKVVELPALQDCPRRDQIRLVSYHYYSAKGPMTARALSRKVLGNEEFCMQIDAHTSFAKNWDEIVKEEWKNTGNEFGIISTVPPPKGEQDRYQPGGAKENEVPRQCKITFQFNGIPVRSRACRFFCVSFSSRKESSLTCVLWLYSNMFLVALIGLPLSTGGIGCGSGEAASFARLVGRLFVCQMPL
jgi:hypothetical protein